jgi:predicted MFS family arabinose efflux permease
VPVFAVVVIAMRTLAGSVPDRLGAERTVLVTCAIGAAGMTGVALLASGPLIVLAVVLFATGQALAVPAVGVLALRRAPASQQGAAAGLFFAWWDAGVGLGGPLTGGVAALSGSPGALIAAAAAIALTPIVAVGLSPFRTTVSDLS